MAKRSSKIESKEIATMELNAKKGSPRILSISEFTVGNLKHLNYRVFAEKDGNVFPVEGFTFAEELIIEFIKTQLSMLEEYDLEEIKEYIESKINRIENGEDIKHKEIDKEKEMKELRAKKQDKDLNKDKYIFGLTRIKQLLYNISSMVISSGNTMDTNTDYKDILVDIMKLIVEEQVGENKDEINEELRTKFMKNKKYYDIIDSKDSFFYFLDILSSNVKNRKLETMLNMAINVLKDENDEKEDNKDELEGTLNKRDPWNSEISNKNLPLEDDSTISDEEDELNFEGDLEEMTEDEMLKELADYMDEFSEL